MQEGSILRKMLLPQCVSHARECLRLLAILWEEGQLSHMVFILQQAFLSAATFMLTVWHETSDVEALSKDKDLIEVTLSMLKPETNRYCSALLRRAQRILCYIAQRALRGIKDEEQRKRVQALIDLHGLQSTTEGSKLFPAVSQRQQQGAVKEDVDKVGGTKDGVNAAVTTSGDPVWEKWGDGSRWIASHPDLYEGKSPARPTPSNNTLPLSSAPPSDHTLSGGHHYLINGNQTLSSKDKDRPDPSTGIEQWLGFEDPFGSALRNDPSEIPHGFEFTTDLTWTDYFSKFLGGLPNPGTSPLNSNVSMSPLVNQTP